MRSYSRQISAGCDSQRRRVAEFEGLHSCRTERIGWFRGVNEHLMKSVHDSDRRVVIDEGDGGDHRAHPDSEQRARRAEQLLPLDDDVPFNVLTGDELVVYVGLDRA